MKKEDSIDYKAGIKVTKKIGDEVEKDEIIAYIHTDNEKMKDEIAKSLITIIKIKENIEMEKEKHILDKIM